MIVQNADDVCTVARTASEFDLLIYIIIQMGEKSMAWKGLERNKLDYILTDLLPVELSELFSFRPFYDFLTRKEQQKTLSLLSEELRKVHAKSTEVMFKSKWATVPFKYNILKGNESFREMSVMQPLSALNLFLFLECYQKDILNFFDNHHCFSIRYHKKNSELYYKTRSKRAVEYFSIDMRRRIGKAAVQQTGSYFKIANFESINSFADSRLWRLANFQFKHYAKMDYKSCFDSVYSHVFKWIIERNVIDSKDASNSNLFITIDRILQNINGRQSNGLIVGPEFSRMVAEVLLQQIDTEVKYKLSNVGLVHKTNYSVFRYVDDIFVFADSQENLNYITKTFTEVGSRYLLRLNELKLYKGTTPCLPKKWLERTRILADVIDGFFDNRKKAEYDALPEESKYIVKKDYFPVDRVKDEFINLMNDFPDDRRTIVSFSLSALLNNIGKKKEGYRLFGDGKTNKARLLIDLAFFIYAFSATFDSTRKLISIIAYMNDELHFSEKDSRENKNLQDTIRRYSFVFQRGNLPDLCDWFAFFTEYNLNLDSSTEKRILANAEKDNNPITWANLLSYSRYYNPYFVETLAKVEKIVDTQISKMSCKEAMMQNEFWYVLVFHNCPHISNTLRAKVDFFINEIKTLAGSGSPADQAALLVCNFLCQMSPGGNKPRESFYDWSENRSISEQITFRTFQRTIFKRYRGNRNSLYASIE
jgi:hypothetical protein